MAKPAGASAAGPHEVLLLGAILLSLFGYPFVAALGTILTPDGDTRVFSIPFRALVLLVTVGVLASALTRNRQVAVPLHILVALAMVLAVLVGRFTFDAAVLGKPVSFNQEPGEVAIFFFGITILPSIALLFALGPDYHETAYRRLRQAGFLTVGLGVLALVVFQPELDAAYRAQSEGLNPITFGTIGAMLILLAWSSAGHTGGDWLIRILLTGLGLVPLITSGSRGPILSLLTALAFAYLFVADAHKGRRAAILLVLLALVAGVLMSGALGSILSMGEEDDAIALSRRLSDVGGDDSTIERLVILNSSWDLFTSSPLLGGGMVEPLLLSYPHNIILEALMVGGILFGIAVTALVMAALSASRRLVATPRSSALCRFIGMNTVYVMMASMLSGSLYRSPDFWAAVALAFAHLPRQGRRPGPAMMPSYGSPA